jgi:hypothetical protein
MQGLLCAVMLPAYIASAQSFPWMKEIRDRLVEGWNTAAGPSPESAVFITNLAYYYGDNDNPSPGGLGSFFPSTNPQVLILGEAMIPDLIYCIESYDKVPRQI